MNGWALAAMWATGLFTGLLLGAVLTVDTLRERGRHLAKHRRVQERLAAQDPGDVCYDERAR